MYKEVSDTISKHIEILKTTPNKEEIKGKHERSGLNWTVTQGFDDFTIVIDSDYLRLGPLYYSKLAPGRSLSNNVVYWNGWTTGTRTFSTISIIVEEKFNGILLDFNETVTYINKKEVMKLIEKGLYL